MTSARDARPGTPQDARGPEAFSLDDPAVELAQTEPEPAARAAARDADEDGGEADGRPVTLGERWRGGVRWGGVLIASMLGLASLAAGVWFARFVSAALAREDWVGWLAFALLAAGGLAALVLAGREVVGLFRLSRLKELRREVDTALATRDIQAERRALKHLRGLYAARPELRWPLARLAEHERDVRDAGDLLALAERELISGLDQQARRLIVRSAKRVATVTAMSPIGWIAVVFVAIENLGMLRALASLYGERPGMIGSWRLARMVLAHIIATGGVAMTDDLIGQFIGQDVLRRLSRRLGEGVFNGALTARVGTAAIEVCRPLPFVAETPIRARDMLGELMRKDAAGPRKGSTRA